MFESRIFDRDITRETPLIIRCTGPRSNEHENGAIFESVDFLHFGMISLMNKCIISRQNTNLEQTIHMKGMKTFSKNQQLSSLLTAEILYADGARFICDGEYPSKFFSVWINKDMNICFRLLPYWAMIVVHSCGSEITVTLDTLTRVRYVIDVMAEGDGTTVDDEMAADDVDDCERIRLNYLDW